jgi:hypothetical protein
LRLRHVHEETEEEAMKMDTIGDLVAHVAEITRAGDEAAAASFMAEYGALVGDETASSNVGWVTGELPAHMVDEAQDLFGVAHPVLGRGIRSPAEAMLAGALWALGRDPRPLLELGAALGGRSG